MSLRRVPAQSHRGRDRLMKRAQGDMAIALRTCLLLRGLSVVIGPIAGPRAGMRAASVRRGKTGVDETNKQRRRVR